MWEKIVLNLLSNALKFTFEGGVSVSLKANGRFARVEGAGHRHRHPRIRVGPHFRALSPRSGSPGPHHRRHWNRTRAGSGAGQPARRFDRRRERSFQGNQLYGHRSVRHRTLAAGQGEGHGRARSTTPGADAFVAEALRWPSAGPEAPTWLRSKLPPSPQARVWSASFWRTTTPT